MLGSEVQSVPHKKGQSMLQRPNKERSLATWSLGSFVTYSLGDSFFFFFKGLMFM